MDKFFDFLSANPDKTMSVLVFVSFIGIAALIAAIFLIRMVVKYFVKYFSKKKFGLKLGENEINYDGSISADENPNSNNPSLTNIEKFASTISTVINYGIETGYNNCIIRQSLYDSQLRIIKNNFELVVTNILNEYLAKKGQNFEFAKVLINYVIEKEIIEKLKTICKADRMAEKTKERVVEHERAFIESAFSKVKMELLRLVNLTENGKRVYQDDILIKALDEQELSIKRMITSSLEEAYDDAVKFLEEVNDNNQALHNKINIIMKSYLESSEQEKLPKEWLMDQNTTPPNTVVGE